MLLFCLGNEHDLLSLLLRSHSLFFFLSFAKHSTADLLDIGKSPLPDSDYSGNSQKYLLRILFNISAIILFV